MSDCMLDHVVVSQTIIIYIYLEVRSLDMQQLSVIDSFHEFAGTTIYGSLALIALVYIWTGLKADFRKKYGWTLVMLFLLCFNEMAYTVIVKLGE